VRSEVSEKMMTPVVARLPSTCSRCLQRILCDKKQFQYSRISIFNLSNTYLLPKNNSIISSVLPSIIPLQPKNYKFKYSNIHLTKFCTEVSVTEYASLFNQEKLESYLLHLYEEYRSLTSREKSVTNSTNPELHTGRMEQRIVYLKPIVECLQQIQLTQNDLQDLERMLQDNKTDKEIITMVEADKKECLYKLKKWKTEIVELLIPQDNTDHDGFVLEVMAGVGGQEAMLFTMDIFNMYLQYVQAKGWTCEISEYNASELSGLRHACAFINGAGAYRQMRFEGGVHRVQRIPKTEKSGRIHTSTITVAILPQASEIQVVINSKDLKIDTKRSSGAGGQHVNSTDSAVRITHLPSGLVVECQTERSQSQNKSRALRKLRALLYQQQLESSVSQRNSTRKLQVGTRARSEKIRTYNYLQDRVTDHRIGATTHNLENFLQGGEQLENLLDLLKSSARVEAINEMIELNIS